jgi:hypothetical protein
MNQVLKTKQKQKQHLLERVLTQQVQLISLKELVLMAGFVFGGAALRAGMQVLPSVEPITFFALLAGWLFGRTKGFAVGASSLYVSNFLVFGGQGPWTLPQALAFGAAGWLGGLMSKRLRYIEAIGFMLAATLVFELIMNFYSGLFFGGNILLAFFTGSVFAGIHLVSNLGFALALPAAGRQLQKYGGFHEKGFIARSTRLLNRPAEPARQPGTKG